MSEKSEKILDITNNAEVMGKDAMEEALMEGERITLPSLDKVLELIEQIEGISEEERENIKMDLLEQQNQAKDIFAQHVAQSPPDYLSFIAMIVAIAAIFVFFGFKLYKVLMERQNKRSEKQRAKQSKKKK